MLCGGCSVLSWGSKHEWACFFEGFFPPALLLPCLILSQPCQLLPMPEDGFLTPMLKTPSSLLAVGRHLSKLFPSHFGKSSNRGIKANDMWGHEALFFSPPQISQLLEILLFSNGSWWVSPSQPVSLSTIIYWNAVRMWLQFRLSMPSGLKFWVHMSALRPTEWNRTQIFCISHCISW